MRAPVVAFLLASALALVPTMARGQDNSASVEALFDEGKRLAAAGDYAHACPKFLSSYNLEHRIGTLLNLADCYEKTGQTASAWARFVEARTLAQRMSQSERADYAKQHVDALAPKLSRLTIAVPHAAAGMQVTRDGTPIDSGVYGVPVPVDPGDHAVEASAPGKTTWKGAAHVDAGAPSTTIEVPLLADAPSAPAAATSVAFVPDVDRGSTFGGGRIVAVTLGGAGVVALGVGAAFGAVALHKKSESNPYCGSDGSPNDCYAPGATLRHDAVTDGNVATVLLGAGGALVVGGVVLWLLRPSSSSSAPAASLQSDGRSLLLTGTF